MVLTTAQFHFWKDLMYVLQLSSGLGFICLFCPAYAEVFKYSGIICPFLKVQGRATKNVDALYCFFMMYGIVLFL